MRRMISTLVAVAAVLVLVVGSIQAQHTRPYEMTLSGTGSIPLGSEIDGHPLSLSLCAGKANLPGGSFTCTTTGYNVLEFRGFDTPNCPGGAESEYVESVVNHIVRFATGDVQYWVPDSSKYGYVCFYGDYATSLSHWLMVGGSGPYEGATGWGSFAGRVDPLPLGPFLMFGFHPSVSKGEITFPE